MNPVNVAVGLVRDYVYAGVRQLDTVDHASTDAALVAHTGRRPVVILPGIYENWRFMRPIAERLAALDHPVHVVPGLGLNRRTIPGSADLVEAFLGERGLRDVLIVAHSKGGLIGKQLMLQAEPGRVAHMIAIGTPFAGSKLAQYTVPRELRELSPTDRLIQRFTTVRDVDADITSIYSLLDPMILDGGALPGAHRNIRIPYVGHFRILADPLLLALVDHIAGNAPTRIASANPAKPVAVPKPRAVSRPRAAKR